MKIDNVNIVVNVKDDVVEHIKAVDIVCALDELGHDMTLERAQEILHEMKYGLEREYDKVFESFILKIIAERMEVKDAESTKIN